MEEFVFQYYIHLAMIQINMKAGLYL